jgi:hypothetical protein
MAAVIVEAIATSALAFPVVRESLLNLPASRPKMSQRDIFRFHAPLMATTLLTLLVQPMTSAALARLAHPEQTLAAGPVVFVLLLVMRGGGLAIQEITLAQSRNASGRETLRKFAMLVGAISTLATASILFSPLLGIYLHYVIHLRPYLFDMVRTGIAVGIAIPLVTAMASWARGVLVAAGRTNLVYRGMGLNLAIHGTLLVIGVATKLPGMLVASGAFTVAAVIEYAYLARCAASAQNSLEIPAEIRLDSESLCAVTVD